MPARELNIPEKDFSGKLSAAAFGCQRGRTKRLIVPPPKVALLAPMGPPQISKQRKEEKNKWSRKIERCNVPCVAIRLQVNSSGIFVQIAA
jgi:hypothetical protein